MYGDVDGSELELDLLGPLLELELGAEPHEVAHSGRGEEVEALGLESDVFSGPIDAFVASVRLRISADGRPAEKGRQVGLVPLAADDERPVGRFQCVGLGRLRVRRCGRQAQPHESDQHHRARDRETAASRDGPRCLPTNEHQAGFPVRTTSVPSAERRVGALRSGSSAGPRTTWPSRS